MASEGLAVPPEGVELRPGELDAFGLESSEAALRELMHKCQQGCCDPPREKCTRARGASRPHRQIHEAGKHTPIFR